MYLISTCASLVHLSSYFPCLINLIDDHHTLQRIAIPGPIKLTTDHSSLVIYFNIDSIRILPCYLCRRGQLSKLQLPSIILHLQFHPSLHPSIQHPNPASISLVQLGRVQSALAVLPLIHWPSMSKLLSPWICSVVNICEAMSRTSYRAPLVTLTKSQSNLMESGLNISSQHQ